MVVGFGGLLYADGDSGALKREMEFRDYHERVSDTAADFEPPK